MVMCPLNMQADDRVWHCFCNHKSQLIDIMVLEDAPLASQGIGGLIEVSSLNYQEFIYTNAGKYLCSIKTREVISVYVVYYYNC